MNIERNIVRIVLVIALLVGSNLVSAQKSALPAVKTMKLQEEVFPCTWQTVIFRNYGFVSNASIARVLRCDEATVKKEAQRLGLKNVHYEKTWLEKGYITVIRNNWFLLPYEQIQQLIGFSEEKLAFVLKEEDFLSVKLGGVKPDCPTVTYQPLTAEQIAQTERLVGSIKSYIRNSKAKPFDFFKGTKTPTTQTKKTDGVRMLHGYLTSCGDVFAEDGRTHLSDQLLKRYQSVGVNALFIHGQLSKLAEYPFDKSLSEGYQMRRNNLKELVKRADKYGIKIILYINEPRAIKTEKFPEEYAHLKGHEGIGQTDLCFSQKEVRDYLYNTVKKLLEDIPSLGGFMTITMSENATHCKSSGVTNCPRCKDIPVEELAASVNNTIYRAIKDSGSDAQLIANLWGWAAYMKWTDEQVEHGIELLDKGVSVLCVSEFNLPLEKEGVKCKLIDYSISNPGPSETTKWMLAKAEATGHKIFAKIQVNNSWECPTVPYLPVFDLVLEHVRNLQNIHVRDLMLTWTQGGWPSPMLDMVTASASPDFNLDKWYDDVYGSEGRVVHDAVKLFCRGFREYPFTVSALYASPKNLGMGNIWSLARDEKVSTMTGYTFDDYERWTTPYGYKIYTNCLKRMLADWREACKLLATTKGKQAQELLLFGKVATLEYEADLLHTQYAFYKRDLQSNKGELKSIVLAAKDCTSKLLNLVDTDSRIAFETANHYFFTSRNLLEQYLHLDKMLKDL